MEKRSAVDAVQAESLVFESNFGFTAEEVTERARSIPAGGATASASENARRIGAMKSPISIKCGPDFD